MKFGSSKDITVMFFIYSTFNTEIWRTRSAHQRPRIDNFDEFMSYLFHPVKTSPQFKIADILYYPVQNIVTV